MRLATDDVKTQEQVLRGVLDMAAAVDMSQSPPYAGRRIHRMVREATGVKDAYKLIKQASNRIALELYPQLKQEIEASPDPLESAIRLAIAGNVIDFGVKSVSHEPDIDEAIQRARQAFIDPATLTQLRRSILKAHRILYLGDNAGEVVFDRLLIEQLPTNKVTYGVRGRPILNDVTVEDAKTAGLCDLVCVIDNGSDAPGTILEMCSAEFRSHFDRADVVIAKGQGNYETLSSRRKKIYFLLMVKCPIIAESIGCEAGQMIFRKGKNRSEDYLQEGVG